MKTEPKVTLLAFTQAPTVTIATAGRVCYSGKSVGDIHADMENQPEEITKQLKMLSSSGHESPIEHASYTFSLEGVSCSLLAQITRHRIASFSVRSQRYVSEKEFDYILPPVIEQDAESRQLFEEHMQACQDAYDKLCESLTNTHYNRMSEDYLSKLRENGQLSDQVTDEQNKALKGLFVKAKKMAQEDARFVLPNACSTTIVVTMNARELKHFFRLRTCMRAQWEIRYVANAMLELVKAVSPELFWNAGPACLLGPCPEGERTCGKMTEMRNRYIGEGSDDAE